MEDRVPKKILDHHPGGRRRDLGQEKRRGHDPSWTSAPGV
jgi:hypothetical protein